MKKYTVHVVWLVIALVALGGGYVWGKAGAANNARAGFAGINGSSTRRFAGGGSGGGFISGQIASFGSDSMTIQLANGNSQVVLYSSSTPVTEPTTVSVNTLQVGTNVMVGGTSNSDGSLTAQSIQVRTGAGGGGSAPSGSGQ